MELRLLGGIFKGNLTLEPRGAAVSRVIMSKIGKISGFPEWLPEQRAVEEALIERIRAIYRSHGFVGIETPAVEHLSVLAAKGVVDKELFAVKRLASEGDREAELALHFDLTVPFARYVAQHFNELVFPFKRYQLQKVWRGERPQRGRAREFYQFDIDSIALETLPMASNSVSLPPGRLLSTAVTSPARRSSSS